MKKLIIAAFGIMMITSCGQPKRYRITDSDTVYGTDSYSVNAGCITFQSDCGCFNSKPKTTIICGHYTITDNPHYQP